MLDWIKNLFGKLDRQQAAADRAAVALEGIADDLEAVRDALRARLTGTAAVIEDHSDGTAGRTGRRKAAAV